MLKLIYLSHYLRMLCTHNFATIMVLVFAGSMHLKRLLKMNSEGGSQACTLYWGQKMALESFLQALFRRKHETARNILIYVL